jgi:hypothetical protein
MKSRRVLPLVPAVLALVGGAALAPQALGSAGAGFTATTLVDASLDHDVRVNSDEVKLQTKLPNDVRVQRFDFQPGSFTGWHHHPGVVIIAIASGSLTFVDADCHATTYGPGLPNGSVLTEAGDEAGQVISANGATSYVTYIVPKASPPVFRIEDNPPACA